MTFIRTSAALIGLGLALAVPAEAGKPTVIETARCDDIGPGTRLCTQTRTTVKTVQTPSGNDHLRMRSRITAQFTSPDCTQDEFQTILERTFAKGAKDQVLTRKDTLQLTGTCFDPTREPTDCLQTLKLHVANGDVRIDRFDFTCRPAQG